MFLSFKRKIVLLFLLLKKNSYFSSKDISETLGRPVKDFSKVLYEKNDHEND